MLTIADQIFELESYSFCPCVCIGQSGWRVSWNLEFQAKSKKIDERLWAPRVTPHYFSSLVEKLEDLNNLRVTLPDRDIEDNEPMFLLYVFEHEAITNIELTFGEWENNEIDFSFSGISNVYASEKYSVNLPIRIDLRLKYTGIKVSEGEEAWAIKKFSKFFNPEDFYPPESLGKASGFIFRPLI
ncbi:MAG: hypothetical protein V4660_20710 [Pseudomonadota bacterium]